MKTVHYLLPLLGLFVGCYLRGRPGAGIDQDVAAQWQCEAAAVKLGADTMKLRRDRDRIPQPGWTACDVMAAAGAPDSTSLSRSGGETISTWCYRNCAGCLVRQVVMVRRDAVWIVEAATAWTELSLKTC